MIQISFIYSGYWFSLALRLFISPPAEDTYKKAISLIVVAVLGRQEINDMEANNEKLPLYETKDNKNKLQHASTMSKQGVYAAVSYMLCAGILYYSFLFIYVYALAPFFCTLWLMARADNSFRFLYFRVSCHCSQTLKRNENSSYIQKCKTNIKRKISCRYDTRCKWTFSCHFFVLYTKLNCRCSTYGSVCQQMIGCVCVFYRSKSENMIKWLLNSLTVLYLVVLIIFWGTLYVFQHTSCIFNYTMRSMILLLWGRDCGRIILATELSTTRK